MIEPPVEVGTGEVSARPHRIGHRWFDLVVALSAICISVISLIVGVQHGHTERDLVQASSWPFIGAEKSFSHNGSAKLVVTNAGVGPAKLESLQLMYNGQPIASIEQLVQICCTNPGETSASAMGRLSGSWSWGDPNQRVLRPGEGLLVYQYDAGPDATEAMQRLRPALEQLRFNGCYCSVFDKCWTSNLVDLKPKPVAMCPSAPALFGDPR